jgi:hypothetical protein
VGVVLVVFAPFYRLVVVSVVFVFGVLTRTMQLKVADHLGFVCVVLLGAAHLGFVYVVLLGVALLGFVCVVLLEVVLLGFVLVLLLEVLMEFVFLLEGKGLVVICLAIVPVSVRHGCESDLFL